MTRLLVLCCFSLLLAGVFGADVTVSVIKGDSVTLPVNAGEIKGNERLQWKFKEKNIANIDLEVENSQLNYLDERFTNRLNLDRTTGSLTISHIKTEETGEYQLEIKNIGEKDYKTLKTFSVTVTDQVIPVSVVKGSSFSLPTGVQIQPDDVIEWKFEGTVLTSRNINPQTGELKITNIKREQFGGYEVKINGSNLFLHRKFSVNINADEVKSVSVPAGETVTLNTDTQTQTDDVIEWKFENTLIAKMDRRISHHTDILDERFKGRLVVDSYGSLIIINFKTEDSGLYDVIITNSSRFIQKRFSLTVSGGADFTVSVMKGDDVTLPVNAGKIRGDERLQWKFKNKIIANIDLEVKTSKLNYIDERFTHRLNLNRMTGSLNINNITTEDTGEYQLEIRGIIDKDFKTLKTFSVTVTDQAFTVSVVKRGDSFSLSIGDKIQPNAVKEWKFNGTVLTNGRFPNTNINHQTGELKITNIKPDQSGEYEVKIDGRSLILHRTFRVNISDEVKSVSGVEGGSVTLNTDNETQADDVIEWKFKNTLIAKVDRRISPPLDNVLDERFRDRLDVNSRGSLIIKELKTEDSGLYEVNITNSKHIIQKRFSLTVTGGQKLWINGPLGWIVIVILTVILILIVILLCNKNKGKGCTFTSNELGKMKKKNEIHEEKALHHNDPY